MVLIYFRTLNWLDLNSLLLCSSFKEEKQFKAFSIATKRINDIRLFWYRSEYFSTPKAPRGELEGHFPPELSRIDFQTRGGKFLEEWEM